MVTAPAGFGKSTLLAQWCAGRDQLDEISAWLTLDEADAEPNQFLTYLIHALDNAGFNVGELSIAADDGLIGTSVHLVLRRLAATFQRAGSPTLLVIDDYHRAKSPAIDKIILDLAEHCAGNLTLCLASREKLFPELASMLASGEALEIDASKLRFTDAETSGCGGRRIGGNGVCRVADQGRGLAGSHTVGETAAQRRTPITKLQSPVCMGIRGTWRPTSPKQVIGRLSPRAAQLRAQNQHLGTPSMPSWRTRSAATIGAATCSRRWSRCMPYSYRWTIGAPRFAITTCSPNVFRTCCSSSGMSRCGNCI